MKQLALLTFFQLASSAPNPLPEYGPQSQVEPNIGPGHCPGMQWADFLRTEGAKISWVVTFQMFKNCRLECQIDQWPRAYLDIAIIAQEEAAALITPETTWKCDCIQCIKRIPTKPAWEAAHTLDGIRAIDWTPCREETLEICGDMD